jgi:hypothetical protein
MQNNVVDKGHGGLTWTPQGVAVYQDGVFGRAYDFDDVDLNYLITGQTTNPFNISDEFTIFSLFQKGGSVENATACPLLSIGGDFTGPNAGLIFHITDGGNLEVRIEQGTSGGYGGGGLGRWRTKFGSATWTAGNYYSVVVTRTNSEAKCFLYDFTAESMDSDSISFSGTTLNTWNSRRNSVGALYSNPSDVNDPVRQANSGGVDKIGCWNKALNESDMKRLISLMHPLNG